MKEGSLKEPLLEVKYFENEDRTLYQRAQNINRNLERVEGTPRMN